MVNLGYRHMRLILGHNIKVRGRGVTRLESVLNVFIRQQRHRTVFVDTH